MKLNILFGFLMALGLVSCGQGEPLQLNHGKRWKANPETITGVENMQILVRDFKSDKDPKAYHQLSEDIEKEFTLIFQNCTMEGEGHNQLHNFLVPIHGFMDDLKDSDLALCKKSYSVLKKHLELFSHYFE